MTHSTMSGNKKKTAFRPWAILFWLLVWEAVSRILGQEILLVSPVSVFVRLSQLIRTLSFWNAVLFSSVRIISGFLLALAVGIPAAMLAFYLPPIRELLHPLMAVIKAIPVASFIILCLVWIPSRNLSVFISFLMVLPIIYTNLLEGMEHTDPNLIEMAEVFHIPTGRRIRYIYFSQLIPYLQSACSVALGLCWKSGIAAEVIGIPKGSMGEMLYQSKIYLNTPDLFAWTLVIILVSVLFAKLFLYVMNRGFAALERR